MLKKYLLVLSLSLFSAFVWADPDDILGVWLDDKGEGETRFEKLEDGTYTGWVESLVDSLNRHGEPILDRKNPDKSKRNQPIVGMQVMSLSYEPADSCYILHYAYDPSWGMSGTGKVWVNGDLMTIKAGKWGIKVTREMTRVQGK